MTDYSRLYSTRTTPQSEPIPGSAQVPNSAGGFAWAVDDWMRLDRFLVLGSEGGTYYIGERTLTVENADAVRRCIALDGPRVVARLVEISEAGRAPKNDPALFVLAMCLGLGNDATKDVAVEAVPRVARIGTHLFHLAQYSKAFRGRGRRWRRAFAQWYEDMDEDRLALQLVKYQQRDGWSHRDVLRLCHAKARHDSHNLLLAYAAGKRIDEARTAHRLIDAVEQAKLTDVAHLPGMIRGDDLPRECVPTEHLDNPRVWQALLDKMPMTAMIRNLGKMGSLGLLYGSTANTVCDRLVDEDRLRKARIHPIALLSAMKVYASGRGVRGSLAWNPERRIVDALDEAFYKSFGNVEPTGKRILVALDVSGSMGWTKVAGMPHVDCREASAAMALLVAKTEKDWDIHGFAHDFTELAISPRQRLDDAVRTVSSLPFGGTDCALPMLWALQNRREYDAFYVLTDSETWAGSIHPVQALQRYREQMGIPAKLIVWGMASNGFTIADPNDGGMMDIVGLDAAAPMVASDFVRGI